MQKKMLAACAFVCAVGAAQAVNLLDLFDETSSEDKNVDRKPSIVRIERAKSVSEEKPTVPEKPSVKERVVEKPVVVEKIVEKVVEKPVEVEKVVLVERTNVVEKVIEKPVEVEKVVLVERTNVVEKVVVDASREVYWREREQRILEETKKLQADRDRLAADCKALRNDKQRLEAQVGLIAIKNDDLMENSSELDDLLAKERDRRQRLERVIPAEKRQFADKHMNIHSPEAFYDRKNGYVSFSGGVRVDDTQYQLCSDRAFVFTDDSNSVKRVVALDNVAITNEAKRAYGIKASYYRASGMVVLYGNDETPAIVRDESKVEDQTVMGEKIRFWVNKEQVEVLKAHIKAPMQGTEMKKGLLAP